MNKENLVCPYCYNGYLTPEKHAPKGVFYCPSCHKQCDYKGKNIPIVTASKGPNRVWHRPCTKEYDDFLWQGTGSVRMD